MPWELGLKTTDIFNVASHPTWTLLATTFALSFLSLSATPSFISLVFLLTTLLLYTRSTLAHRHPVLEAVYLWVALAVSISLSRLGPALHALSSTSTSIWSLIALSSLSSAIALVPLYLCHRFSSVRSVQPGIVFPSLWAITWLFISWTSPIGRLITWTPLTGISSYRWIAPFLGFAGLDWITAAWASVAAEVLWGMNFSSQEEVSLLIDNDAIEARKPPQFKWPYVTILLLALTIPSFFVSTLPLTPISSNTTPLAVACILPEASEASQLERFVKETRRNTNLAKVLLWPESAVTFETSTTKQQALDEIQEIASASKVWIGVSFEERVSGVGRTREGQHRNGMALVGPDGVEMTYYKRRLVPIAESFSQIASDDAPQIHTIDLPRPRGTRREDWGPSETRPIPLSASICLDFSAPLTSLDSWPALVLAPAKTWHTGVGQALYELARARGDEIGAEVLWCDGGAGGLSGVAGSTQVGTGSWVKVIGIPYQSGDRARTVYGVGGDWLAVAAVLGIPALILATQHSTLRIEHGGSTVIAWTKDRANEIIGRLRGSVGRRQIAQAPQLIDDT